MRALLDVNLLIALLDSAHIHHTSARAWLEAHIDQGWASCRRSRRTAAFASSPRPPTRARSRPRRSLPEWQRPSPRHGTPSGPTT
jgi:predicted nucleic acid-binding protein